MTIDYISYWKQKGEYGNNRIQRMLSRKHKRKENGSKSHKCERCKRYFPHKISLCEDPYYKEIYDTIIMVRLCSDCYEDACGDI